MWRNVWIETKKVLLKVKEPESLILINASILLLLHHKYFRRGKIRRNILGELGIKVTKGEITELYSYAIWGISSFFFYFVVPLILIKLLHRRRLTDFGVGFGDYKLGLKIFGLFLAVMLPLTILVGLLPDICNAIGWAGGAKSLGTFSTFYPKVKWINPSLIGKADISTSAVIGRMLLVHLFLLIYFIGWEFIYRGYMLFGLYDRYGFAAILIANIPFVVLHYSKPLPEALGSVIAGIALCVLALKTRSFWPCAFLHWVIAASMEMVVVFRSLI